MNARRSMTMAGYILALAAGLALPATAPAQGDEQTRHERERRWDGHGGRHDERRGERGRGHDDHGRGNGWGHERHWQHERFRERGHRHDAPPRVASHQPAWFRASLAHRPHPGRLTLNPRCGR